MMSGLPERQWAASQSLRRGAMAASATHSYAREARLCGVQTAARCGEVKSLRGTGDQRHSFEVSELRVILIGPISNPATGIGENESADSLW